MSAQAKTAGLRPPPRDFDKSPLFTLKVRPEHLLRVSRFDRGEPYFGRPGGNRFDDNSRPLKSRFGTCYFGLTLLTAFAETVLHDEIARGRTFHIAAAERDSRYVVRFTGKPLVLADFTGENLKRHGADGQLSTIMPYALPQRWARALHRHPDQVDGMLYVSRHINTQFAVVLFGRAKGKISATGYTPLAHYAGVDAAARSLGVRWV